MYSVKEKRLPKLVAIVRLSWKPYHKLTPPFISSSGTVTYPLRLSAFSMYMAGNSLLFFYYKVVLTSTVELARYSWEGPRDWYWDVVPQGDRCGEVQLIEFPQIRSQLRTVPRKVGMADLVVAFKKKWAKAVHAERLTKFPLFTRIFK